MLGALNITNTTQNCIVNMNNNYHRHSMFFNILLLSTASIYSVLAFAPIANSQTFTGNDISNGPFTSGFPQFRDNSTFNADTANALSGGVGLRLSDTSTLNVLVAGAINTEQHVLSIEMSNNSTINAMAEGGLDVAVVRLYNNTTFNILENNATTNNTGIQFYNNSSGVFKLNGNNTTLGLIDTFDNTGILQNGGSVNSTLTVDTSVYNYSNFGGSIIDGGLGTLGLAKIGEGTLVLSGVNTYTGGTTLDGGELWAGVEGAFVNNTDFIVNAGSFELNNFDLVMSSLSGTGGQILLGSAQLSLEQDVASTYAGAISGTGSVSMIGNGEFVLTGENTYSGGTTITSGLLQIGDGGTSGSIVGDVINNSVLAFNRIDTLLFEGEISGTGDVRQTGTGITVINKQSFYSGTTFIKNGTLAAGGTNYFSSNSDFDVSQNSILDLGGFDQSLAALVNSGTINFGSHAGTTLTVDGDYNATAGLLLINTVLGDDSSLSDILVINGNVSGTSLLNVRNVNGSGAQTVEGIKVIEVGGLSTSDSFILHGDYVHEGQQAVVGGAYVYKLYQGSVSIPTDGDWYLRSQLIKDEPEVPLYQSGVPTYEVYPQTLLGLNGLNTLQQRVGNRVWTGKGNRVILQGADAIQPYGTPEEAGTHVDGKGVWGRIEGGHSKFEPHFTTSDTDYQQNIFKMQAGIDGLLSESESGQLIGGVSVHYAHGKTKTSSVHGDGEISTDGYGLGGTLTWYGDDGIYLDGQGQVTWYNSDLTSTIAQTGLIGGNHGFGYALSVESGKRWAINPEWSVTPQAQLVYSKVDFDSYLDVYDATVRLDKGDSLQGRLGMTIDHETSWQNVHDTTDRAHVYSIANLYYEFLNGTQVDVAGTSLASKKERLWGGLGLGGSYNWNNDKYSLYGEGLVNTSLNNLGDNYSVKGNVGFRMKW